MSDMGPEDIEALVDEIHALRAENQRLRSLLGLDEPSRHEVTEPWEPTLFVDSDRQDLKGDVNGSSPAEAKIALFRLLVRWARGCLRPSLGECADRKDRLESCRRGWLGERQETRSCVSAA